MGNPDRTPDDAAQSKPVENAARLASADSRGSNDTLRVLIFMATAGGGHLAAARAIEQRLTLEGHEAVIVDGPQAMSPMLRWLHVDLYAWLLKHLPWAYQFVFQSTGNRFSVGFVRWLLGTIWGRNLLDAITQANPTLVISTFPTVTACLGQLCKANRLSLPVIATVSDFGVHPMWVSPYVDTHLVLSQQSRRQAARFGARSAVIRFPVDTRFRSVAPRDRARQLLGLPPGEFVCLVMGGAWGVGNLEETADRVIAAGGFPVVVTGRNERLRKKLEARFPEASRAQILGWTDHVPLLMSAADCLIQNAGGVSCLEALEVGLPIVFFRPLSGHGLGNALAMEAEGVASMARSGAELERLVDEARTGRTSFPLPPASQGADLIWVLRNHRPVRLPAPARVAPQKKRWPGIAMVLLLILWLAFSSPVPLRAASLIGHPVIRSSGHTGEVVVFARITDPQVARAIVEWLPGAPHPLVLFVDAFASSGTKIDQSADYGLIPSDNGGWFMTQRRDWGNQRRATSNLRRYAGVTPEYVLLDNEHLRLGVLLGVPRETSIIVAPSRNAYSGSDFVIIDTNGLSAAAAIDRIEEALLETCQKAVSCVSIASYLAISTPRRDTVSTWDHG